MSELTKGEQARHEYNARKAKARHYEIIAALNEFTIFAMEFMRLEGMTDKGMKRLIFQVGKTRRRIIVNSRENKNLCLHAGDAIGDLQKGIRHLKSKLNEIKTSSGHQAPETAPGERQAQEREGGSPAHEEDGENRIGVAKA